MIRGGRSIVHYTFQELLPRSIPEICNELLRSLRKIRRITPEVAGSSCVARAIYPFHHNSLKGGLEAVSERREPIRTLALLGC